MICSLNFKLKTDPMNKVVEEIGKVPPRPLNSGEGVFCSGFCGSHVPSRASRCSRSYDVLTLVVSFVQSLQLLISLRATMIAMITMSTTRMISRISVRPIPSSPPVVVPVAGDAPVA